MSSLLALGTAACENGPDASPCDPLTEFCDAIPNDAVPCADEATEYWPLSLRSVRYPLRVHYPNRRQQAIAERILTILETAWQVEVVQLGFSPPLADGGLCGPDDDFDVFVWRDLYEGYVSAIAENPATAHDDWFTYMAVDPWGPYGGDALEATLAHELNHACQAADDWWESPLVFEMTATFVEELVFPDAEVYFSTLGDFQAHPDWSLDRDDDYETWYMYGAALYLHFLREHYFAGDGAFAAAMWRASRSAPDGLNEPDFVDALDDILGAGPGIGFAESVAAFSRWRWYTGGRDDGEHFADGPRFPADTGVPLAADISAAAASIAIDPAPMLLGSSYVRVTRADGEPDGVWVSLQPEGIGDVRWSVEAVPGGDGLADGERLDLDGGPALLDLSVVGTRTLIITALPTGDYDPDERGDARHGVTLVLGPGI